MNIFPESLQNIVKKLLENYAYCRENTYILLCDKNILKNKSITLISVLHI